MAELYLLDWQETKHGKQPKPAEVDAWLKSRGINVVGLPKVYANGTVQVTCEPSPEAIWPDFAPIMLTLDDRLSVHIKELLAARAEVLHIPENRRNAVERLLLANTALLLFGYGVTPDA